MSHKREHSMPGRRATDAQCAWADHTSQPANLQPQVAPIPHRHSHISSACWASTASGGCCSTAPITAIGSTRVPAKRSRKRQVGWAGAPAGAASVSHQQGSGHSTAQHGTAQHSTAQHSTARQAHAALSAQARQNAPPMAAAPTRQQAKIVPQRAHRSWRSRPLEQHSIALLC